jgi:hypothetical protein
MDVTGNNIRAIHTADYSLAVRGRNLANSNQPGFVAQEVVSTGDKAYARPVPPANTNVARQPAQELPTNSVDMAKDLVGSKTDAQLASYNMKMIKAQDSLKGDLLNLLA